MFSTLTVSFFGHRYIENVFEVEDRIEHVLKDLIQNNDYVEILVGRNGEFDFLVASVANRLKKHQDWCNLSLVWVQPYAESEYLKNADNYDNYYDSIEVCEKSAKGHFKSAIQTRNRCMIDRSDLVVCFAKVKGGAYSSRQYAQKQGKTIVDI